MTPNDQSPSEQLSRGDRLSFLRTTIAQSITRSISAISVDADRDAAIAWLGEAREVLRQDGSRAAKARKLYGMTDSRETLQVVGRAAREAIRNYRKADLPLAIKVATPITALGVAAFGMKGAGIAAFGGAVGMPVAVLLFLGTAGVTSVLEAFVKDKRIGSPHAQIVLTLIALEGTRRYRKSFLESLQQSVTVPERSATPDDDIALLRMLRKMHPTDFERHVMSFFIGDDRHVGVTPHSNDFGVDGFVTEPDGSVTVVQCKRNSEENRVGRPTVQQFKGVIEEQGAKAGYIVTTSEFTAEAKASADKSDKVTLVDCRVLVAWHRQDPPL